VPEGDENIRSLDDHRPLARLSVVVMYDNLANHADSSGVRLHRALPESSAVSRGWVESAEDEQARAWPPAAQAPNGTLLSNHEDVMQVAAEAFEIRDAT
jgi:hypothetical protein